MSSSRAIAAVTAILKDLLNNGLISHDIMSETGPVKVSALPPDLIDTTDRNLNQLNIFLYQVTPNQGWRNIGLPARDARGERVSDPPLALDLHYMLTAYCSKDLYTEMLLGYSMQLLHEMPVLTRDTIRKALAPDVTISNETPSPLLPPELRSLSASDLAEQVELMKITPNYLGIEEISKLWSALQSHYRPTVTYIASVVLIESQHAKRTPLPVLTCGFEDRGVSVQPSLRPSLPGLTSVIPPNQQASARLDDTLTLQGYSLDGANMHVRFVNLRLQKVLEATVFQEWTETCIRIRLKDAFDTDSSLAGSDPTKIWSAGFYSVMAFIQKKGEDYYRVTNELSFSLAPTIINFTDQPPVFISAAPNSSNDVIFNVKFLPEIRRDQQASLIVGHHEIPAELHPADSQNTLVFIARSLQHNSQNIRTIPPGEYPVRLRINGVESILIDSTGKLPKFAQKVNVP
jgi:hypothetical protein